ncbi:CHRD domain containing protein [Pyrenophora teres f. maculata]|nr:CHRD domain containing protein [Pyrenophora teres f. maculata]
MRAFILLIAIASLVLSVIAAPVSGEPIDISTSGGFKIQLTIDISENGDAGKKDIEVKALDDKVDEKFDHEVDDKLVDKLEEKVDHGKVEELEEKVDYEKVDEHEEKVEEEAIDEKAVDKKQLFDFTSQFFVNAVPEEVVNGTEPTGGIAGASGTFNFGINSVLNMICYEITLHNFQGEFSSPATTATHIHEAKKGESGPPRISFPNPEMVAHDHTVMHSAGCLKGPFITGVMVDGKDTGEGFHVSMIEADPASFMSDTHSSVALAGAVRGQLG